MDIKYYGILMILIGLFMTISGLRKSEFMIYKLLVKKSEKLWGENVHRFYQITGMIIIVIGIIVVIGML
jgi:predicted DNA-binding transcriptional regulator